MTAAASDAPHSSPWLSLWFSPGTTIGRIVAANPRRHVLLLAALGTMSSFVVNIISSGATTELIDWRIIAGIVIVGALYGIAALYLFGLTFWLAGRVFGGRASSAFIRAAYAWGSAPAVLGLAICLIALVAFKLLVGDAPASSRREGLHIALLAVS